MKKALVVLLALTCLSAMAFADDVAWTFGVTVKTGAAITMYSEGDATIAVNDADDAVPSRVRFDADAALGDFSAHVRVGGDTAGVVPLTVDLITPAITAGNFIPAWWVNAYFMDKMIQMQFGILDHSVTDTVNKGWGGLNTSGAQVVVTPMSGLSVGLALPANPASGTFNAALAGMKLGFGYTMTDLVTIRATYMNAGGDNFSSFAAGVAVLAVPNLTAQVEVLDTNIGDDGANDVPTKEKGIELFENFAYKLGALTPGLELYQVLYNDSDLDMMMYFKPNVDYMVMEGLNVGASVKYAMNQAGGTTSGLVADPYVKFTFNAKAALKIDAAYTIADLDDTSVWSLPININFMFAY